MTECPICKSKLIKLVPVNYGAILGIVQVYECQHCKSKFHNTF